MIDTITSDELKDILLNGTPETIKKVITNIHPADILDILHEDEDSIKALMDNLPNDVVASIIEEEDDEEHVLRKLNPKIPDHNDAHPIAENMKLRKDAGLRKWRLSDPYAIRRRTPVDYRFHTKEQQDFYETVLLDKKPIVCDMRWVDWTYMKENEEHHPGVYDSFKACGVDDFVAQKLTKWNDELIMQFYSTAHFYPNRRIVWMSEGTRYQSTVEEWAQLINAPKESEDDLDIYAEKKKDHNTMANMYKEVPDAALDTHKFGSVHYLLFGLPTIN